MKNTILYFVLFILFQSHAQSISLKNLISIESNEQFERIAIENNYEKFNSDNSEVTSYKFETSNSDKTTNSSVLMSYMIKNNEISIEFNQENIKSYNRLFDEVKKTCSFYSIIEGRSYYRCPENKLKKVGFKRRGRMYDIIISDFNELIFPFSLLKKINSADKFKAFCSTLGFDLDEERDSFISYILGRDALGYPKIRADYSPEKDEKTIYSEIYISLFFSRGTQKETSSVFENLLTEVKSECEYWGYYQTGNLKYDCYTCLDVDYDGKIGFLRGPTMDVVRILKSHAFN